jgi:acyl-CoA hydrolase
MMDSVSVEQSKVVLTNIMSPAQCNQFGIIHGGEIVRMMDNAAGLASDRFTKMRALTAQITDLEFIKPVYPGNILTCRSQVTFTGGKSLEVYVRAYTENHANKNDYTLCAEGYFIMVAIDEEGKSHDVPMVKVSSEEERILYEEGRKRYMEHKTSKLNKNKQTG